MHKISVTSQSSLVRIGASHGIGADGLLRSSPFTITLCPCAFQSCVFIVLGHNWPYFNDLSAWSKAHGAGALGACPNPLLLVTIFYIVILYFFIFGMFVCSCVCNKQSERTLWTRPETYSVNNVTNIAPMILDFRPGLSWSMAQSIFRLSFFFFFK